MGVFYFCKKINISVFPLLTLLFFLSNFQGAYSQIKVYERPTGEGQINTGLFFESDTRKRISLNGQWDISFNEGLSYDKFIIPIAYDFKGDALYKKKFSVPDDILNFYSFIFVAEGIDYESEIKINNNFIAKHTGGGTPVISPLADGIISANNEIAVKVSSGLNYRNTVPLSDQINYSKVFGGISKDIYIIAVPKLFVFNSYIKYTVDNLLSVKVSGIIEVKSTNLFNTIDTSYTGEMFVQTRIIRKSDSSEAGISTRNQFTIGENNSLKITCDLSIPNAVLWTNELPEIYIAQTNITDKDGNVIDQHNVETGFTNLTERNGQIFISGRQIKINGINYYEDQPKYATALDYSDLEKDLRNIKAMGFNAVRVPGRCAHPYIVNICNRIGLFLLQEIPLNELAEDYFEDEKYARLNENYLADIIERDKNAPCIFAWGIGNDFDVSSEASRQYVMSAVALTDTLNKRFTYYTSKAGNEDICSELVNFVGINFYERSYEKIIASVTELTNKAKPPANRKNNRLFVSYYGLNIENGNSNGFSDIRSQEAQMKFYNELFPKVSQAFLGNFMAAYADWNSENPLNYPLDINQNLKTNGLYTFNREQKRSVDFVKRILNNEDLPRIQEGNHKADFPYAFIIIGLGVILLLIYFVNRDKKFRTSLVRCLYKPTYFYFLVKDQMIISTGYNLLLTFCISIGLALFFSSIMTYYAANNSFDMILAKIFTSDSLKMFFTKIVNNKFYLITSLTVINLLLTFLTAFFLYFISFYTKGKSFFKNIYTVSIWSTLPMLIFLFAGTVIYKLSESNPVYIKISMWIFIILYVLYLNRIILGAKSLFDVRTGKVYLYGILIIFFIFAIIYSYFYFFTGALETMSLVSNLTS